ncbi:MAG: ATP-binding protein [Gemmatimonadota bacterium]
MIRLHAPVGHGGVRSALLRAREEGGLPASLLFHGYRGIGKQRLALWTAQLQLCEAPTHHGPCGDCKPCRLALGLEHPDIHWYFPLPHPGKGLSGPRLADALERAHAEALEQIRMQPLQPVSTGEVRGIYLGAVQRLRRQGNMAPTMSAEQVFIIGDAELLVSQEASPEAANALLKLLEEPPPSTRFILTSSEPGRLLPTIRSRSVPVRLSPLPAEEVSAFLREHTPVDEQTARWAAELSQGSIGRALGFLPDGEDPGPLDRLRRQALQLVEAALAPGRGAGYAAALNLAPRRGRELVELLEFVEEWIRDLAAVGAGVPERVLNRDVAEHLRSLALGDPPLEAPDLAEAVAACQEARELARGNVNPRLIVAGLIRRLGRRMRPRRVPLARS